MAEYNLLDEIKTESHVGAWIYAFDLFFLIGYIYFSYCIKGLVAKPFQTSYMIFSVICAITLTIPSPFNKKRRMYQSILIYLKRNEAVYHPAYKPQKKEKR